MKKCGKWFKHSLLMMAAFLLAVSMQMTVMAANSPSINKKSATLTVGKTLQLKMKNTTKKVSWSSSNKKVATVTSKGKVKAIKAGTAKITAKVSGKKYTCKVTVKNANSKATGVKFANATGGDFVKGVSKATASFKLNYTSTGVEVRIQTLSGKTVYTKTFAKCKENKAYSFTWNGKKKNGSYAGSGTYRLCIVAGTTKTYSKELKLYAKEFQGGDGSKSNPYQVKTFAQLKNVNKYNGRYFVQVANINGDSANFVPLFTSDNPFTGVYNGKGFAISNLYFRKVGDAGIFASVGEKGVVRNLKANNFTFVYSGTEWQYHSHGMIAGVNKGTISNCKVENATMNGVIGTVQGGICGWNSGLIEKCTAKDLKIISSAYSNNGSAAAGIVGYNGEGTITDCSASNLILSGYHTAGIVGNSDRGKISGCSTTGSLSSSDYCYVGAIAGYASYAEFVGCYTDTDYDLIGGNWNCTVQ